ncbi:AraC family transcriptional regulator [Rhizosphaericola mali]|uniref:AraC family transcriptional regulator n=1 Tax=Rhizosphaericola mali TaxID=2545455 RepID=A0A5P2FY25_9BACT|nr:helix-turn-helix domain-containing protein [Rhizosphaericola mali]QES88444.1 AraC family transcriptional regulator [Rhizosphaericola mali]
MQFTYSDSNTNGHLILWKNDPHFDRFFFGKDRPNKLLTIAWNTGENQQIKIDGINYNFPSKSVLPLMVNQSFTFTNPKNIVAWQFNRDFYCIVDHDKEVSCVGFIFYGLESPIFLHLTENLQRKFQLLLDVFLEEIETKDNIQMEMLQMLLKRLIILVTRQAKLEFVDHKEISEDKFDVIRDYNILVENHFKEQHSVQFYADHLHKSPKTLSNYFALYHHQSPLAVIQQRIILEAKRLLMYTESSAKEIAYELGFEEVAHFSNYFKNQTGMAPSEFKQHQHA